MAVFKCKMCGAALERQNDETVLACDYCGTTQTLPKTSDDNIANLFNRANNLRLKCEFDKAAQIYEKIVEQDDSEAEAHWGIVLCKYGIEYVEDPATNKRIPTCHRTHFEAITTDADYQAAIDYSDFAQQEVYQAEAKAIDKIQKDILAVVRNEKPFDVFICYKETDASGSRTRDSVIANDIYYQLTNEGYKVFYAAITLEDKLGQEYEPYIFAALNSAKVMLVVGTQPEYFSAVWVKNEWSRFLQLMKKDRSRLLIPCYRDIDPYDLPDEFAHLQAQDMGKIGFINDLVRGIKKVVQKDEYNLRETNTVVNTVNTPNSAVNSNVSAYLKRVNIFLENGNWESADEYCEKVLDIDPENAEAYLGKLMAELRANSKKKLVLCEIFENNINYVNALRFADAELSDELSKYAQENRENIRKRDIYKSSINEMEQIGGAYSYIKFEKLAEAFKSISGFMDADAKAQECLRRAEKDREAATIIAQKAEEERLRRMERERLARENAKAREEKERLEKEYLEKQYKNLKKKALPFYILCGVAIEIFWIWLARKCNLSSDIIATNGYIPFFLLGIPMLLTYISFRARGKSGMILALIAKIFGLIWMFITPIAMVGLTTSSDSIIEPLPTLLYSVLVVIFSTHRRKVGKAIFKKTGKKQ